MDMEKGFNSKLISMRGGSCCLRIQKQHFSLMSNNCLNQKVGKNIQVLTAENINCRVIQCEMDALRKHVSILI